MTTVTMAQSDARPHPLPRHIYASLTAHAHVASDSTLHKTIVAMSPSFVDWKRMSRNSPHFYLGNRGTGTTVHFHSHSYNVLVHGRKRWVLLPPRHAVYSTKHIQQWLAAELPMLKQQGRSLECIQEPGDVLYVPRHWGHGVVNLAESVGYAMQFSDMARDHPSQGGDGGDGTTAKQRPAAGSNRGTGGRSSHGDDGREGHQVVVSLASESVASLKQILKEDFDDGCQGCITKTDVINRIKALDREKNSGGSP
jgi:hypothetical protein